MLTPDALRILRLMDLTTLSETDTPESVAALCARGATGVDHVAAVCVFPRFLPAARRALENNCISGVRLAAVANFPHGRDDWREAVADVQECLQNGAQEVDLVFPYHALLAGQPSRCSQLLLACRKACEGATLKVILETGVLQTSEVIGAACALAAEGGADFLKTSTGKTAVHATPEAAQAMLAFIAHSGLPLGFKASGGLRTLQDARVYLDLADAIMGTGWATPATFRFGASGLLSDLLAHTAHDEAAY